MDYSREFSVDGDGIAAFRLAESSLLAAGFRLSNSSESRRQFHGPGMNSSRQNALVGASELTLARSGPKLVLEAELGGVRRMQRFILWFPSLLIIGLAGLLSTVFFFVMPTRAWVLPVLLTCGANLGLWLVLGPIMSRTMRNKTIASLDGFAQSLTHAR
jgi:hypothetical protein